MTSRNIRTKIKHFTERQEQNCNCKSRIHRKNHIAPKDAIDEEKSRIYELQDQSY